MTEPEVRPAARVVVLGPERSILLQRIRTPEGWDGWITLGGALEPGESALDAARRELIEEVGVRDVELTGPIWVRRHVFEWNGRLIDQREEFFVVRLADRVVPKGEAEESTLLAEGVVDHRWWELDDLARAPVVTAPRALASLVRELVDGGPPSEPMDVGE